MKILITSLVIVLVGIFGVYQANASGISIDWTGDDLIKKEAVFTDDMNSTFGICRNVDSIDIVSDLEYMNGATLKSRGCVVEGKDVDMYVSSSVDIDSDNPRNFAIRIKPSGKFYSPARKPRAFKPGDEWYR